MDDNKKARLEIAKARKALEKKTKQKIISKGNYLIEQEEKKRIKRK